MKIAVYSHSIAPSIDGVCRRFTGILHELADQGHETLLFTMEEHPLNLPSSTQYVTLDYMVFPSYPDKKVARPSVRSLGLMYSHLQKFRPDVLHVVADGFSQMFVLVAFSLGIPVVGSFHTDLLDLLNTHNALFFQKGLVMLKEAIDSLVLDSCATTSKSFLDKLKGQGVHCSHVIVTAVDNTMFHANKRSVQRRRELMFGDDEGFLCVYVGRISSEKRIDIIIDAIQTLRQSSERRTYLAIIGDGPSAAKYAALHGRDKAIYCVPRFLEHDELAEIYASSDVHVSASEFETLGNTVLEAFACNIPVVVPRTQGFNDTVRHTVDGFLFEPGNSTDARRYIQLLKDDAKLRVQMGEKGRVAVKDRSITNVVNDLTLWYRQGMQQRSQRSLIPFVLSFGLVSFFVPVTIFMFLVYDILVSNIIHIRMKTAFR